MAANHSEEQTFISPVIGMDYARIKAADQDIGIASVKLLNNEGFDIKSLYYGLKLEQVLTEHLQLQLSGDYTSKELDAYRNDWAGHARGLLFHLFRLAVILKYFPLHQSIFSLGAGPTYHYISNVTLHNDYVEDEPYFIDNRQEYGLKLAGSAEFKNVVLEVYFNFGIDQIPNNHEDYFKPIQSVGFNLGYLFQIAALP